MISHNPVTIVLDRVASVQRGLSVLASNRVMIGIPAEKNARDEGDGSFGNAAIGYVQEHGAPEINLPARPHLIPGVRSVQKDTITDLRKAASTTMSGGSGVETAVLRILHRIGMRAQNAVRGTIREGLSPPLAESTLAGRRARGRTGTKPLWDTGDYLRHITYVIRKR